MRGRGVCPRIAQGYEPRLLLCDSREGVEKITSRSGQAVKLGHDQHVTGGELVNPQKRANSDETAGTAIRNGTEQQFAEQTAATQALRGRMADIDNYNIKGTTNVFFDVGKTALSPTAKADLCNAANTADPMQGALLLVVGYTDSTGSDELNQTLSEKRASSVINYLQQVCHWKPYRMLTPTGMAEADPLADNTTEEGKAQNRRVSVNVLVSKGLDGLN